MSEDPRKDPLDAIARRALEDVPETDEQAKARALARLRDAIDLEGSGSTAASSKNRKTLWIAAVAGVAAVLTLLALILPAGRGGPSPTAASELQRMAVVASAQPAPTVPADGEYVINQVERRPVSTTSVVSGNSYTIITQIEQRRTVRTDGSAEIFTRVLAVEFRSEIDRAAWVAAGSPSLPQPGDEDTRQIEPGQFRWYDVEALPTDIDELRRLLRGDEVVDVRPGPDNMLSVIVELLAQPNTPPDVRAALFELASTIPGMTLVPEATDPLGRPGVGVSLETDTRETELIIDPESSAILSISDLYDQGTPEEVLGWIAYQP